MEAGADPSFNDMPRRPPRLTLDKSLAPLQPWAWEAREFLRKKLAGKEVTFRIDYAIPTTGREIGTVTVGNENITHALIKAGLVRVREAKNAKYDPLS